MNSFDLSVIDDSGAHFAFALQNFPCRVGRAKDCEVGLPGWRVGRVHAVIEQTNNVLRLVDQGTLNGTWVNGQRIVEYAPLDETDEILIGGYRLRLKQNKDHLTNFETNENETSSSMQTDRLAIHAKATEVKKSVQSTAGEIDQTRELRKSLHQRMIHAIDLKRKDVRSLTDMQLRAELTNLLIELIEETKDLPIGLNRTTLINEMLSEALGLGPLDSLLADNTVSEIMVNSATEVFVERNGVLYAHDVCFSSDEAIRAIIDRIVQPIGRRIDDASPMVDARLPDGSRVNAIVPPLALRGPSITIRKFNRNHFSLEQLVQSKSLSNTMARFLEVCVVNRKNIIVSGGTGSGKTTLLNVLSSLIPDTERIVTIEDSAELKLHHRNLVGLEARPANIEGRGAISIRDLVRNSLRMRPDRIVVGEVRGGEALDMLQAMNTGHDGSLTTVHANSARDVFSRLEVMSLMAGIELPVAALREQICSAVDVIVHQSRFADGARRISSILEVSGIESGRIQALELFKFDASAQSSTIQAKSGGYVACGVVPSFYETLNRAGVELDYSIFERVEINTESRYDRTAY